MISLEEARDYVWATVAPLDVVTVPVAEALGARLASDVTSTVAVPPFDNTAVDGFAVRAADLDTPGARLRIIGTIAAGDAGDGPVGPGEAVRIMTGAPIPPGADAVAMVEVCEVDDERGLVTISESLRSGAAVRSAGDDIAVGAIVLRGGDLVTAGGLGLLCTLGLTEVAVIRRPRVGVISTGDELVQPGRPLGPGQIHDSNRATLLALVHEAGCEVVDLGLIADDEDLIEDALVLAAATCDAVISSGGVSMGDFDFVKVVLDRIGDMRWMQIGIRPAKPLAFGRIGTTPVFGLPGNPVSSMVSFELFARPALRAMAGHGLEQRTAVSAVAPDGFARRPDGKVHFMRVSLGRTADLGWEARSSGGQGSHQLSAMAHADGLAMLPDGDGVAPGGTVEVVLLH